MSWFSTRLFSQHCATVFGPSYRFPRRWSQRSWSHVCTLGPISVVADSAPPAFPPGRFWSHRPMHTQAVAGMETQLSRVPVRVPLAHARCTRLRLREGEPQSAPAPRGFGCPCHPSCPRPGDETSHLGSAVARATMDIRGALFIDTQRVSETTLAMRVCAGLGIALGCLIVRYPVSF
jgi:hypothetical protein